MPWVSSLPPLPAPQFSQLPGVLLWAFAPTFTRPGRCFLPVKRTPGSCVGHLPPFPRMPAWEEQGCECCWWVGGAGDAGLLQPRSASVTVVVSGLLRHDGRDRC